MPPAAASVCMYSTLTPLIPWLKVNLYVRRTKAPDRGMDGSYRVLCRPLPEFCGVAQYIGDHRANHTIPTRTQRANIAEGGLWCVFWCSATCPFLLPSNGKDIAM